MEQKTLSLSLLFVSSTGNSVMYLVKFTHEYMRLPHSPEILDTLRMHIRSCSCSRVVNKTLVYIPKDVVANIWFNTIHIEMDAK
jgi:hypothetical protein